ncbi:MAG: hypothetical protein IJ563_00235 [Selenomonadaceae bacterium]|nr:hypothetical protein [Selenomonadaceae bacterium]
MTDSSNYIINGEYFSNSGGRNVTINGGEGYDGISNAEYNDKVVINSGNGGDWISNFGDNGTINAGAGRDTIKNYGKGEIINTDSDDDHISNKADNVTINCGIGDDIVGNRATNVLINGDEGNDKLYNEAGKNATINAGLGDDYITNYSPSSGSKLNGGEGNDYIYNSALNVTINGGIGNDRVQNDGDEVLINGDAGNDTIINDGGIIATINGGDGNDSINNVLHANYVANKTGTFQMTISGGKGNDTIINNDTTGKYNEFSSYNVDEVILYSNGDGNDVVENYSTEDKIKLLSGKISKAELNGNDVVIKIGDGSIKLKEAKDKQVTVLDSNNKTIQFKNTYNGNDNDISIPKVDLNDGNIKFLQSFSDFYKKSGFEALVKNDVQLFDFLSSDAGSILKFAADIYKLKNFGKTDVPPVDSFLKMVASGLKIMDSTLNFVMILQIMILNRMTKKRQVGILLMMQHKLSQK